MPTHGKKRMIVKLKMSKKMMNKKLKMPKTARMLSGAMSAAERSPLARG